MKSNLKLFLVFSCAALLSGCGDSMREDRRIKPYEESPFFEDGMSVRQRVEGTVHRDAPDVVPVPDKNPVEVTAALLERGRERFGIYCSVCHGAAGYGDGIVVRRGFRKPSSFHEERLRGTTDGHFFKVITEGFGVMQDYKNQVAPADRWAIVAYIRALQLSQHAPADVLSEEDKMKIEDAKKPETETKKNTEHH